MSEMMDRRRTTPGRPGLFACLLGAAPVAAPPPGGSEHARGGAVYWDAVLRDPRQRVWYAEGSVRAGPLLPRIPVRAVVVLYITEGHDAKGRPAIRHEGELVLHTDNRLVALAARVMGVSAPHAAEQYVAQIQTFFAALAWHLDRHPEKAKTLLAD